MALALIGAGFGRTGTLSFKSALETIGYGPCYHMMVVQQHPSHSDLWSRATDGEAIDWSGFFEGFRAAVDWPACAFWRELASWYPEAKVVLTRRDSERWYDSVHNTIYQAMTMEMPAEAAASMVEQRAMARKLILEGTFGGRFEDRAHAIGVYERHNQEVLDAFGSDRLLDFEVANGWEPLCQFLGVEVPDCDFPRVNTTEDMRGRLGLDAAAPAGET